MKFSSLLLFTFKLLLPFISLFLTLFPLPTLSQKCSPAFRLDLFFTNQTAYPDALCADGSNTGFYYGVKNIDLNLRENRSYVIWLGDTNICSGQVCTDLCEGSSREADGTGVCEGIGDTTDLSAQDEQAARCLYSRATCTSDWWTKFQDVTPETILCEDDSVFKEFKRVFVPSCTLDYWLGTGDPTDVSSTRFRGDTHFRAVISTLLDTFDLAFAPKIVFGGTRGAGIGAMHQLNSLKQMIQDFITPLLAIDPSLTVPPIYTVLDSSWIVSVEKFAPTDAERADPDKLYILDNAYKVNTSDWLSQANLVPSCKAKWESTGELYKCLYVSELIKFHIQNERILIIQSQYDLFQLGDLGLTNPDAGEQFVDEAAFAQAAITFVENYGQSVRSSINEVGRGLTPSQNVYFITAACGQHGYIVPTRVHAIEPTLEEVGDAGSIQFQADETIWVSTLMKDKNGAALTIRKAIIDFQNDVITNDISQHVLTDECGEFLCNPDCKTKIFPFRVTALVSKCIQQLVFVYAFFLIFIFMFFFILSYFQIAAWRRKTARFWEFVKSMRDENEDFAAAEKSEQDVELYRILNRAANQDADEVQRELINESNVDSEYRRVHLMLENVSYWPPARGKGILGRLKALAKQPNKILNEVSVSFEPGKVHALMGPSGSGKSTLLELISLSKSFGKMSGSHYINGVSSRGQAGAFLKNWLKLNMSYVAQQDFFFPTLTLREHLEHAAWLILPEYMSDNAKLNRVWKLIKLLDLTDSVDTICGDGGVAYASGLSGGQRRRLSVATQLLLNPCVLFLDEPTSGLDSVSALSLCKRLQTFASKAGVNVIMTIHQPRHEIYQYIDNLYILVKGNLLFAGTTAKCATFFGLDRSNARLNIGNEILDMFKKDNDKDGRIYNEFLEKYNRSPEKLAVETSISKEKTFLSDELAKEVRDVLIFNSLAEGKFSWREPSSVFWIQWVLISRTLARGAFNIFVSIPLAIVAGCILGALFFQKENYDSKTGLAYLTIGTLTFLQGVFLARRYFDEKDMYDFEYKSGTMKSWQAFLFAQFCRDGVTAIVESLAFSIPVYFLGGFNLDLDRILIFMILTTLTGFACTCQNILIQVDRNQVRQAATIQIGLLALGALFNGFIVQLDDLPIYYAWIPYIMLAFYGFVGVLINELGNFSLPCNLSKLECATRTGDVVIRVLSYNHLDVFICVLCLIILVIIFRSLAITDFYFRYAQSGNVKRVGSDGTSRPDRKARAKKDKANEVTGQTMTAVINAPSLLQTSARFRSPNSPTNTGSSSKNFQDILGEDEVGNSNMSLERFHLEGQASSKKFEKVGSFGSSKGFSQPDPIIGTPIEEPIQSRNNDFFGQDSTVVNGEDEDDQSLEEEDQFQLETKGINAILLSRSFITLFFLFDLFSAGYVCAYNDNLKNVLIGVSLCYLVFYGMHFLYQLAFLIPYTLNQTGRDFVWASEYDGPSLVLLIGDICLAFLQFQISDELGVRQIMTLSIRVVRLIRVQLYWYKVSKAHRVRAESFLEAKEEILKKMLEKQAAEEATRRPPRPELRSKALQNISLPVNTSQLNMPPVIRPSHLSGNFLQNIQQRNVSVPNQHRSHQGQRVSGQQTAEDEQQQRPTRPPRPSQKQLKHISMNNPLLLNQQLNRFQRAANLADDLEFANTYRPKRPTKLQHYSTKMSRPIATQTSQNQSEAVNRNKTTLANRNKLSGRLTQEIQLGDSQWRKFKNKKTGEIMYYNVYTGQLIPGSKVIEVDSTGNRMPRNDEI